MWLHKKTETLKTLKTTTKVSATTLNFNTVTLISITNHDNLAGL